MSFYTFVKGKDQSFTQADAISHPTECSHYSFQYGEAKWWPDLHNVIKSAIKVQ